MSGNRGMRGPLDFLQQVQHTIRIPESSSVELPRGFALLVDHPDFQRLRQVRQLGPIQLVYPGAVHTRFEHSLGVFWASVAYLKGLLHCPAFRDRVEEEDLAALLGAALLHDVGHYPSAHSLEALHSGAFEAPLHEDLSVDLIQGKLTTAVNQEPLGVVIEEALGVDRGRVASLVAKGFTDGLSTTDRLLASIINSAIDADKLDYLRRDSIHMGVPYGRMPDLDRLSASLTVNPSGDRIALTEKGRVSGEIFLFCRHLMFSEAYWHHTVRSASAMFEAALEDYIRREKPSPEALLHLLINHSDDQLMATVARSGGEDSLSTRLVSGLSPRSRRLYKRVLTLDRSRLQRQHLEAYDVIYGMGRKELRRLADRMRGRLAALSGMEVAEGCLLIDTPPRDKDRMDSVEVVYEQGGWQEALPLEEVSQVARGIATDFVKVVKKIRVFVEPSLREALDGKLVEVQRALLEEILVGGQVGGRSTEGGESDASGSSTGG
ncbi:MAG: HD domain-containing protein [Bradymonadales bacterium]|nr:HD domain-containing protein [Bradymonadales bacterium]